LLIYLKIIILNNTILSLFFSCKSYLSSKNQNKYKFIKTYINKESFFNNTHDLKGNADDYPKIM